MRYSPWLMKRVMALADCLLSRLRVYELGYRTNVSKDVSSTFWTQLMKRLALQIERSLSCDRWHMGVWLSSYSISRKGLLAGRRPCWEALRQSVQG